MKKITRYLSLVILALAFVGVSAIPASATTMTIQSIVIPQFQQTLNPGETLYLVIYVDRPFISSAGIPIQAGSPQTGRWYKRVTCTVVGTNVTIPAFTLDSTTDAQDIPGKAARYSAYWYANTRMLGQYGGFESFRVLPVYTNPTPTDATWAQIRADNTAGAPISFDRTTLTSEQIIRLINDEIATSGGVTTIEGQAGPTVTITDDTNVTITGSGNVLTVGWAGTLAVARGGSGSGTAAGARTNLGAAASGANSDITSLSALSTPLSAAQGGSGIASYTVGDLLYASGATTLSKLADVATGSVLVSGGTGTAPAWSASPTLTSVTTTNLTVSSLTTGRVPYVGAADLLSDDSGFLWDATNDRLSIGTTLATNSLNLPNAGYLGGSNLAAGAVIRMIGVNASDYVSIAQGGNRSVFGGVVTQDITGAADFSGADTTLFHPYQDTPTAGVFATRGVYSTNGAGNNFHLSSYVTTAGTRATVAGFFEAIATDAAGTSAFGINPVSYTIATGTTSSTARAAEFNFGVLGNSTNAEAYGLLLAAHGNSGSPYFTVPGTVKSFIRMQLVSAADAAGAPADGIEFLTSGGINVIQTNGALMKVTGTTNANFGLNFEALDAAEAPLAMSNDNYITGVSSDGNYRLRVAGYTLTTDLLAIGHPTYQATGQRGIIFQPGSAETMRITRGASTTEVGNVGLNQATPTAQLHQTTVVKRALTLDAGTAAITNGTPNLTVTNGAFTTEVAPGSSIEISAQAGTYYTVLSITDDDNLVLTANYTGSTTLTSNVKSDYRPLYITNANASVPDPWFEIDNYHAFVAYGNSTLDDLRGMIRLVARATPAKQMTFGVDNTGTYGYISSFQSSVGWKPLILQGGASSGDTGGVVIGVPTPSSVGAMLKVEGAGVKAANNVGTEFNNIATSAASFQKVGAQYISSGSWIGPNLAGYFAALGAVDTTSSGTANRWNVPVGAFGGSVMIAPHSTQVTSPAPPVNVPTATLDVYGYPAENATDAADETAATNATDTVTGANTEWMTVGNDDYIRVGDAVMFGSEGTVAYEVDGVTSNTQISLSGATAGTNGATEMYQDPALLLLRNGFGSERFRVESSGFTKVSGTFVQKQGTTLASAASLVLGSGNVFVVTGNVTVTNIYTYNGLGADSSEAGRVITLIWGPAGGDTFDVTDGGNLKLSASIAAFDSDDTLTLYFDGTNFFEIARSVN